MAGELILVVEDYAPFRQLLADVLTVHGYVVRVASTGENAVELARREPPALVLMDIQMPGMGGFAAMHAIRALPLMENTRVVALTASPIPLGADFDATYLKPVNLDWFVGEVGRILATA